MSNWKRKQLTKTARYGTETEKPTVLERHMPKLYWNTTVLGGFLKMLQYIVQNTYRSCEYVANYYSSDSNIDFSNGKRKV